MAYTYTYAQALNAVTRNVPKVLEDQYSAIACNMAMSLIWDAADWRESVEMLPPFYLQPGDQDHGPPLAIVPDDFQGLRRAQIQDYTGRVYVDLAVSQNLNECYVKTIPTAISYESNKKAFRLYPRVSNGYGAPTYMVTGTYKKKAVQITNSTLNTLLPLDDKYFDVWIEAIRWAFFVLDGNQRAGALTIQDGRKVYTGQLATVMNLIDRAVGIQETNDGENRIHPARPLVFPRGWRLF